MSVSVGASGWRIRLCAVRRIMCSMSSVIMCGVVGRGVRFFRSVISHFSSSVSAVHCLRAVVQEVTGLGMVLRRYGEVFSCILRR